MFLLLSLSLFLCGSKLLMWFTLHFLFLFQIIGLIDALGVFFFLNLHCWLFFWSYIIVFP